MLNEEHRSRDIAIIIVSFYFCAQSIYIVLKMWTSLSFNDKVNAMETVIVTMVVLCGALEILYFYKFDETKSGMFTGELFGLERRILYKYGDQAVFRGRRLIGESRERRRRLLARKNGKFFRKTRLEDREKTVEEIADVHEKGFSTMKTTNNTNQASASNIDKTVKNSQDLESNFPKINNDLIININNYISTVDNLHEKQGKSSPRSTEVLNPYGESHEELVNSRTRSTRVLGSLENEDLFRREEYYLFGRNQTPSTSSGDNRHYRINKTRVSKENEDLFRREEYYLFGRNQTPTTSSGNNRHYKQFFYNKSVAIIEELLNNNLNFTRAGLSLLGGLDAALLLVPLQGLIRYLMGSIEFKDLKFTFMVYVPFTGSSTPANLTQFIVISIVQTLYIYLFYLLSSDSFLLESLSNTTLKTEIKLFLNNLEEFDAVFCAEKWDERDDSLAARLRKLRVLEKLGHIVAHHQTIFRKTRIYQETMAFLATYFNLAVCVAMCTSLFLIQQGEFFFKIKYSVAILCLGLALALYSEEGQDIEDGFEEMRDALYKISWHNMSVSLRKSLVILLTRHSLPPKVTGSYGIFVINRKNVSMIMRASYSYLSFLNQFKRG